MTQPNYYRVDYQIERDNGSILSYGLDIHKETLISRLPSTEPLPNWARMDHERCEGCTLPDEEYCPVAARLVSAVTRFSGLVSHSRVIATVTTPERSYVKEVDMQEATRSLFGLIMATSGCPSMQPFRFMARYHLPFSTIEETIARIVSTYLLRQMFTNPQTDPEKPQSVPFDIKEVENLYRTMQRINESMARRLKTSTLSESSMNAIIILGAYSSVIPLTLDREMRALRFVVQG
jgi:hypothetical protein